MSPSQTDSPEPDLALEAPGLTPGSVLQILGRWLRWLPRLLACTFYLLFICVSMGLNPEDLAPTLGAFLMFGVISGSCWTFWRHQGQSIRIDREALHLRSPRCTIPLQKVSALELVTPRLLQIYRFDCDGLLQTTPCPLPLLDGPDWADRLEMALHDRDHPVLRADEARFHPDQADRIPSDLRQRVAPGSLLIPQFHDSFVFRLGETAMQLSFRGAQTLRLDALDADWPGLRLYRANPPAPAILTRHDGTAIAVSSRQATQLCLHLCDGREMSWNHGRGNLRLDGEDCFQLERQHDRIAIHWRQAVSQFELQLCLLWVCLQPERAYSTLWLAIPASRSR